MGHFIPRHAADDTNNFYTSRKHFTVEMSCCTDATVRKEKLDPNDKRLYYVPHFKKGDKTTRGTIVLVHYNFFMQCFCYWVRDDDDRNSHIFTELELLLEQKIASIEQRLELLETFRTHAAPAVAQLVSAKQWDEDMPAIEEERKALLRNDAPK